MKTAIIVCCLVAVAMATPEWEAFKTKFNRKYKNPTEEAFRKKIFLNNKFEIDRHNQRFAEGKTTFTMGINQFADLTTQEFNERYNNYKKVERDNSRVAVLPPSKNVGAGANTVDWRTSGCVTGVKDQGQCGSCWAFSTTGSVEFACCRARGNLVSLSEQNLVDCTYSYGNLGCNGGLMDSAFQYVIDNNGIDTEASYPYSATSAIGNCKFNSANIGCTISGFKDIPTGSESQLQSAVDGQVVSVAIDASRISFQLYAGGVYDEPLCSSTQLDHGVLAVGYGNLQAGDTWLVKNSWGTSWGEAGYINMSRNKNNQCGIATEASYPVA
ncbi:hypothetical protein CHUAL_007161 [Chamberlinius hualienensis]